MISELPRAHGAELMDDPHEDPAELRRSLRDLEGVNRWLGGKRVVLRHLGRMLPAGPAERPFRLLDVATGGADLPLAVAGWAERRGTRVEIVATDLHPETLEYARERSSAVPEVRVERADALSLPYPDASFDVALCSTALHHFGGREAVRVLRELARVARRGVIVGDLRRSRTALVGARLLAGTVWRRSRITRHDGPLSIRRAFTPPEAAMLAQAAGWEGARVHTHPPFRLALVLDRREGR